MDLLGDLFDVVRDDLLAFALEDFELAFFAVLPLAVCLPFTLFCLPDETWEPDGPALRARAGGTGSFQLNASICAPT